MNYASVPMQECTVAKICKQHCHEITDPREYSISLPSASASQDLGGVALSNANTSTIILIRKVYMIYYDITSHLHYIDIVMCFSAYLSLHPHIGWKLRILTRSCATLAPKLWKNEKKLGQKYGKRVELNEVTKQVIHALSSLDREVKGWGLLQRCWASALRLRALERANKAGQNGLLRHTKSHQGISFPRCTSTAIRMEDKAFQLRWLTCWKHTSKRQRHIKIEHVLE